MTAKGQERELRMIPVDRIDVLNPRERNSQVFDSVVANIQTVGLKKPITVTPRPAADGAERYLLVCGEGRLKAFRNLGETRIPALIVHVSDEDAYIMSLAENVARRHCRPLEFLASISDLRTRGYSAKVIGEKTGLTTTYVQGILVLVDHGEQRLLIAVQKGGIPLNSALTIANAGSDDKSIQTALQEAYETGQLRGRQLVDMRRILERRKIAGPMISRGSKKRRTDVTSNGLVRTFRREVERQKLFVLKATLTQQRVLFITTALRRLLADDNFTNLLRAEGLETLPKYLAERAGFTGPSL